VLWPQHHGTCSRRAARRVFLRPRIRFHSSECGWAAAGVHPEPVPRVVQCGDLAPQQQAPSGNGRARRAAAACLRSCWFRTALVAECRPSPGPRRHGALAVGEMQREPRWCVGSCMCPVSAADSSTAGGAYRPAPTCPPCARTYTTGGREPRARPAPNPGSPQARRHHQSAAAAPFSMSIACRMSHVACYQHLSIKRRSVCLRPAGSSVLIRRGRRRSA